LYLVYPVVGTNTMKEFKVILTLMFLLSLDARVYGQIVVQCDLYDSLSTEKVYKSFDKAPTFGESLKATLEYVGKHFKYPHHYSGKETVIASIIVSESGKVTEIKFIKKSKDARVNENFMKVLETMKEWNPALLNGKKVKAELILPLKLQI
jgi:hypothetical protein